MFISSFASIDSTRLFSVIFIFPILSPTLIISINILMSLPFNIFCIPMVIKSLFIFIASITYLLSTTSNSILVLALQSEYFLAFLNLEALLYPYFDFESRVLSLLGNSISGIPSSSTTSLSAFIVQ